MEVIPTTITDVGCCTNNPSSVTSLHPCNFKILKRRIGTVHTYSITTGAIDTIRAGADRAVTYSYTGEAYFTAISTTSTVGTAQWHYTVDSEL